MKETLNNDINNVKRRKIIYGIIISAVALVILTTAIVLGYVIASKLTCSHDNECEIEILPYKSATCIEEGLTMGKRCNYCGKIFVKQETIPKTECRATENLPYIAPTCKETGLSEGKICSVCGKIVVAQQIIQKVACSEGAWIVDKESTKTTDGSRHTECRMCGKIMQSQVVASGSKGLTYVDQKDGTYLVKGGYYYSDPDVVIPRMYNECNVVGIQYYAFMNNKYIESLKTPSTITFIDSQAFYGCENLKMVILAEGIEVLAGSAFKDCTSLESITLPSTLATIGYEAFFNCTSLTTIEFEGTVEQWNAISLGTGWCGRVPATEVICSNGTVSLN